MALVRLGQFGRSIFAIRLLLQTGIKRQSHRAVIQVAKRNTSPQTCRQSLSLVNGFGQGSPSVLPIVFYHHYRIEPVPRPVGQLLYPGRFFLRGGTLAVVPQRCYIQTAGRVIQSFSRLRYLVVGSAIAGGVTITKKWEDLKQRLPGIDWVREYVPTYESLQNLGNEIREQMRPQTREMVDNIRNAYRVRRERVRDRMPRLDAIARWFDNAMDGELDVMLGTGGDTTVPKTVAMQAVAPGTKAAVSQAVGLGATLGGLQTEAELRRKIEELQAETMAMQLRYQKELERLEKENRELRKQLMLRSNQKFAGSRSIKKSLIDLYSEVLDELADYDTSYSVQDHLPRVVVVGDQSSGKTSVLEMLAQARIFPRGSGEMMTRAPVKVTLSEGPYHVARFKDSNREFDLTKEAELQSLRKEVELRMKSSVGDGKTISTETISMTVKGPGIPRMVLVDLPGIISTVTTGMAEGTKKEIRALCRQHMENPNSIILCIQDGSLDAERSNVTDLASEMDPYGKRTIFVLTKVDLAEANLYNPDRIKEILEGRLFPMHALGYFAVVTGKGAEASTIQEIREHEDKFFQESRLFKDGVLRPNQMTTRNLSLAVSDCFWKMVRASAEQQADAFKAARFNLETEWKNTYPTQREMDREELFEKSRADVLDEVVNLSQVTAAEWDQVFDTQLWLTLSRHVLDNIFLPSAQSIDVGVFNTTVDIKLRNWVQGTLPHQCVQVGRKTLLEKFSDLLAAGREQRGKDGIFDKLEGAVEKELAKHHQWDAKAEEYLRVIQRNALQDRVIPNKAQWDKSIRFMEDALHRELADSESVVKELTGPGSLERWTRWCHQSSEQKLRSHTMSELEKLFSAKQPTSSSACLHKEALTLDEVTTVRKNLEASSILVDNDFIRDTWTYVYRNNFLKTALERCRNCRKGFYHYAQGLQDPDMDCREVVLFWRIQRMLAATTNALRQQVVNAEARHVERNVREILDELGSSHARLGTLLTGSRVRLAEELKRVRHIQEMLEEFVLALDSESKSH